MYETGRTVQVAQEMRNYNISLLGLCETRWLQAGQLRLTSEEKLLYSGHTEEGAPHTEGVALMLAPEAQRALIGVEPVSLQNLKARKEKKAALNVSRTRLAKAKAQEEYTAADKEVKTSMRTDKREHINSLASQAEEAAAQGKGKRECLLSYRLNISPLKDMIWVI
ncbi:hypothetical protein V1264_015280 [Littorina saxatilis]|uniref:Uncharacterized protein n=1 Tax=Littorina saxatilis TaxID=31220 RepID=A0AAN9BKW6_9CAEN